ncbi:TetR/AcrR family transcriptional regulator [Hoyosella rhizosphaerae]|uniref:TetR/AcrR family transcriptional regulator n=1 Tax=Hoyosella rhizosphaerae TaxID=1755582 RepID=UPI001E56FCD1|nr:TetR/AcrR family transcriptional regulator [Hoyosella rhizosphaerae]
MRTTRSRQNTRSDLIKAAFDVFANEGFGRATVEKVCSHAGFTRGAFYSNFTSLDELFLAMWEERAATMLADVENLLAASITNATSVENVVEQVLHAIPVDDKWFRITAEFTAYALRNPPLHTIMAAREDAIIAAVTPLLTTALHALGRHVADPVAFGHALVAVHDGTTVQCLIEPDNPAVQQRRTALFTHVVLAYSEPIRG